MQSSEDFNALTPLFKKLNLKSETSILVQDAHESFGPEPALLDGVASVRMVAVNDDWSALRFRKTEYVKKK